MHNTVSVTFTTASVLALSPDDASSKAARGLLSMALWGSSLGRTDRAVWGLCKGSGSKPYQTQVDLRAMAQGTASAPSFRCSCPSRKFPCKHGLALLLLLAQDARAFGSSDEPAWVVEWIEGRQERDRKKQEKQAERAVLLATDPQALEREAAAAAKREESRWLRIEQGMAELERFLCDRLRTGLASMGPEHVAGWTSMAQRMVDAQAPALGEALHETAALIGQGVDWPRRVASSMGRLQLSIEAVRRRATLASPVRNDLRAALGWVLDRDAVMQAGEHLSDVWLVVGVVHQGLRDPKLSERRVWLVGGRTGRRALILEHTHGARAFERTWVVGSSCETTLAFFPGAHPLRALPAAEIQPGKAVAWPAFPIDAELATWAGHVAASPWTPRSLMVLRDILPVHQEGRWWLQVGPGRRMALSIGDDDAWALMASCASMPVRLAAEWDGDVLQPLAALSPEGLFSFHSRGGAA